MANLDSAYLKGADELMNLLKGLPDHMQKKALTEAVREGAKLLRDELKRVAPVSSEKHVGKSLSVKRKGQKMTRPRRPGDLRRSIGMRKLRTQNPMEVTYSVGPRLFYARFLEYGTRKMSAKPFIRPTLDRMGTAIANAMAERLAKSIEVYAAKLASGIGAYRK